MVLCRLANVSRSGYYKWLKEADKPDKDYDSYLKINEVFDRGKGKYGWRSIKMYLPGINHKKIQRIMRKYDLVTKIRRRNPYKAIMKKRLEHRTFPNILDRKFQQTIPLSTLCTDITYLPSKTGYSYLSVVKDIASGEVAAWNVSAGLEMDLVIDTIKKLPNQLKENALIHSDQGLHYTNPFYIKAVTDSGLIQSMSHKGSCIDNAPIESFFGHLKDELDYKSCQSIEELRLKIEKYMRYYNQERKQWTRNRMTPVEYRNHLLAQAEGSEK